MITLETMAGKRYESLENIKKDIEKFTGQKANANRYYITEV